VFNGRGAQELSHGSLKIRARRGRTKDPRRGEPSLAASAHCERRHGSAARELTRAPASVLLS
jgi:hypothetical protein